eukprot:423111-Rhodomonas_salina.3
MWLFAVWLFACASLRKAVRVTMWLFTSRCGSSPRDVPFRNVTLHCTVALRKVSLRLFSSC